MHIQYSLKGCNNELQLRNPIKGNQSYPSRLLKKTLFISNLFSAKQDPITVS